MWNNAPLSHSAVLLLLLRWARNKWFISQRLPSKPMLGKPLQKTINLSQLDRSFVICHEPLSLRVWELEGLRKVKQLISTQMNNTLFLLLHWLLNYGVDEIFSPCLPWDHKSKWQLSGYYGLKWPDRKSVQEKLIHRKASYRCRGKQSCP